MFVISQNNQSPGKTKTYRISSSELQKILCFSASLFEVQFTDCAKAKYAGT